MTDKNKERYVILETEKLVDCYSVDKSLVRYLDDVEGYELRELEIREYGIYPLSILRPFTSITPSLYTHLLSHRGTVQHLAGLVLLLYLDKLSYYHRNNIFSALFSALNINIKYTSVLKVISSNQLRIKQRSRPDIGYKHRRGRG